MSSLTQLLADHARLLVLDAASTRIQVGLLQAGQPAVWHCTSEEAGTGIFTGTAEVLRPAGLDLDAIGAFVFCEGPGSMLGTRTVAMALRTWTELKPRPVYTYQSLALAAHAAWTRQARAFTVIADARRDTWHAQTIGRDGHLPPLQRLAAAELPAGELQTPENFRAWAEPPRPAGVCPYDLALIIPVLANRDCFRLTAAPDAFQHEAPTYKKWSAQIHRPAPLP